MERKYYKNFIDAQGLTQGRPLATCGLGESISQVIYLLVTTRRGEMPGNPDFGCLIWDLQFEIVVEPVVWKTAVEKSLREGIARYEKRLTNTEVQVSLSDVESVYPFKQHPEIKKQALIQVKALLKDTGENFNFSMKVFVSPLAH
ncbi:MAG: hypothetical protein RLZZ165_177 [Bacteroidota bacterium]